MSLRSKIGGSSTDSKNDSDAEKDDKPSIKTLAEKVGVPDPDFTAKRTHKSEKYGNEEMMREFLNNVQEMSEEEFQEMVLRFEDYRLLVDRNWMIGDKVGEADSKAKDFKGKVSSDKEDYEKAIPAQGEIVVPLYRWTHERKQKMRDNELDNYAANLPIYRACWSEPHPIVADHVEVWQEREIDAADGWDSHAYIESEEAEDWSCFEDNLPPETVEEAEEVWDDDPEPEPEVAADQCAAIASTTGDRCTKDAEEGEQTCPWHDDEESDLVDTTDYSEPEQEATEEPQEDTTGGIDLTDMDLSNLPDSLEDKVADKIAEKMME